MIIEFIEWVYTKKQSIVFYVRNPLRMITMIET